MAFNNSIFEFGNKFTYKSPFESSSDNEKKYKENNIERYVGIYTVFLSSSSDDPENPNAHLSTIPRLVQEMFNEEYGISVEYDFENRFLRLLSDQVETKKKISTSARNLLIQQLTTNYAVDKAKRAQRKARLKYGRLVFGNSKNFHMGWGENVGTSSTQINWLRRLPISEELGSAFINLFYFNNNLDCTRFSYQHLDFHLPNTRRTINMARFFEHSWLAQVQKGGAFDTIDEGDGIIKMTKYVNQFRREMNLPEQVLDGDFLAFDKSPKNKKIKKNIYKFIRENYDTPWTKAMPTKKYYTPMVF